MSSLPTRKRDLTPAEQRLLAWLQRVNFGRIRRLEIRDGQPVFEPPPRLQRDHKFGGRNGPRRELDQEDYVLKKDVAEMFQQLRRLGNGTIANLEVRDGLPVLMTDEEVAS